MKKTIDNDINLFLPRNYNFLLLGGNFLLAKRLYEITKRQFEVKRFDYDFNNEEEYFPCIESLGFDILIEPAKKIQTLIDLYNSNVLIFTSEIFLLLNDKKFDEFLEVIKHFKQKNIKLIFISISNPIHICKKENNNLELSNMYSKKWYIKRIFDIKKILDISKDLIFECSSYATYVKSNIQSNILDILSEGKVFDICSEDADIRFDIYPADYLINFIIENINDVGEKKIEDSNSSKINLSLINQNILNDDIFKYIQIQSNCSVNLIYRKKPNEIENQKSVANWRFELGCMLSSNVSDKIKENIDIIVPVPETGKYYAQGLAQSLGKTYVEAFYKKFDIGRSFDISNTGKRQIFLDSKLGLLEDLVKDKVVAIVDEAIFTGQTLYLVQKLLRQSEVKKIYFFIASPQCSKKCQFNMMPQRDLLSNSKTIEEINKYFNTEGIIFQDFNNYKNITNSSGFTCTRCFE